MKRESSTKYSPLKDDEIQNKKASRITKKQIFGIILTLCINVICHGSMVFIMSNLNVNN